MHAPSNRDISGFRLPFAKPLLVALAYYLTGILGLSVPVFGSQITLFWLPTGIAVAALMRWGYSCWPGISIGAFLVNLVVGPSYPLAAEITVGNTLAPLLTAWLLKHIPFHVSLDHHQDIPYLCLASALGMLVSASNGTLMLWLAGVIPSHAIVPAYSSWWLGDTVGVLLAAPLLLTVTPASLAEFWHKRWEFLAWILLTAMLGWMAFISSVGEQTLALAYLPLPMVVWAALRFGVTGASFATLLLSLLAVLGTTEGGGPFHSLALQQRLFLLWAYMATLVSAGLMATALLAERRAAEHALQESNTRLRALFNTTAIGMVVINERGIIDEFNPASETLFGYASDEVSGKNVNMLMPEPYRSQHDRYIAEFIANGQAKVIGIGREAVGLHKSGATFPMELYIGEARFSNRRAFVGFVRNIAERKQLEAQTKRFEAIVQSSTDAIISKSSDGTITSWNPGAESVFGYRTEEMIGQPILKLFPADRLDEEKLILERIVIGEKVEHFETIRIHKSGRPVHVSVTISPIFDEAGNITGASHVARDITAHKEAEEKIHNLAFYDSLTRLPNRRLLTDRLEHALATSARLQKHGALLFLDLDNFKMLNDTLGHQIGDELLIQVAHRLQQCVRESDTIARLGGDEFVVLLEDLDPSSDNAILQAKSVAEKVGAALSSPYALGNVVHHSSTSIGITLFMAPGSRIDTVLLQADTAMYEAKKSGKNAYRFFDPAMQQALERRVTLESTLRTALANGELRLYYQPQVDGQGRLTGAEALIRWQCPENGIIFPIEFIPLADETGIIFDIGRWVLETACAQLKKWESHPKTRALSLSINVSARQFYQPGFVQEVRDTLLRHAIDPTKLKLELTESMVLEEMDKAIETMQELKSLGLSLAMDDFGTGYSSLSYLRKLPFDQIKIDKSFVDDIKQDSNEAFIVGTVITIGKMKGMSVIAEGVENFRQTEFLLNLGCSAFQGYYFGEPVPIEQFEVLLK